MGWGSGRRERDQRWGREGAGALTSRVLPSLSLRSTRGRARLSRAGSACRVQHKHASDARHASFKHHNRSIHETNIHAPRPSPSGAEKRRPARSRPGAHKQPRSSHVSARASSFAVPNAMRRRHASCTSLSRSAHLRVRMHVQCVCVCGCLCVCVRATGRSGTCTSTAAERRCRPPSHCAEPPRCKRRRRKRYTLACDRMRDALLHP